MTDTTRNRIENLGVTFRFLTPILIAIVGYFTIQTLGSIDKKFEKVDIKFDMFLESYHEIDKRVDRIEWKMNGE